MYYTSIYTEFRRRRAALESLFTTCSIWMIWDGSKPMDRQTYQVTFGANRLSLPFGVSTFVCFSRNVWNVYLPRFIYLFLQFYLVPQKLSQVQEKTCCFILFPLPPPLLFVGAWQIRSKFWFDFTNCSAKVLLPDPGNPAEGSLLHRSFIHRHLLGGV